MLSLVDANVGHLTYSEVTGPLIHILAQLSAAATIQSNGDREAVAEVFRHEFDVLYLEYLDYYDQIKTGR